MEENPDYLAKQLITYIGSKRSLLGPIGDAVQLVKSRLGRDRLRCLDAFSGSGAVSRLLKAHSSLIISNDLENYAAVASRCYLTNRSDVDFIDLERIVAELNHRVGEESQSAGFIERLYSPNDESNITSADRAFYTRTNARRLDRYRQLIDEYPQECRDLLLGPLLSEASIHANTAGVFKGFYKNRRTKLGQFGGSGSDALSRILGEIKLVPPVLSNYECDVEVHQRDANELVKELKSLDLAYLDPPYNQHPYGSNYFMLNLIVNYQRPDIISTVSGIPADWRRSGYNVKARSETLFSQLLNDLDAAFLLVSFNNEGFIEPERMQEILAKLGSVQTFEMKYNAFRGSRSFKRRSIHTTERLFLVERR